MPSFNLGDLNAATDPVSPGCGTMSINVSVPSAFVGEVLFERRTTPNADWAPIARDSVGTLMTFTGASGDLIVSGTDGEPDAQIRARVSAYTSGAVAVRIGRV